MAAVTAATSGVEASNPILTHIPSIKIGDMILQFDMGEASEQAKEIALCELRETDEIKEQAVAELKNLLDAMPEINFPKENKDWLVRFLRPCKFYAESARDLIKRHYAYKKKHSDLYDNLLPSREENVFKHNIITLLRKRDQLGRRILLLELGKRWQYKQVTLNEVFKAAVIFLEIAIAEPESQICGIVVIFDMDGLSLKQTMQFTPMFAKRIVDFLQDSVPLRVKAIHVINQPKIFNVVFALFQQFLREKLRSRIFFHGTDRESLHTFMSPKFLPTIYGGDDDMQRVDGEHWWQLLLQYENECKKLNSYGLRDL